MNAPAWLRRLQIHLYILPARGWDEMLRFRDALREDPALAAAYAAEKRRVADLVAWNKAAYADAKGLSFAQRSIRWRLSDDTGHCARAAQHTIACGRHKLYRLLPCYCGLSVCGAAEQHPLGRTAEGMVLRTLTVIVSLAGLTAGLGAQAAPCSAPDAAVRLDHAIVVVRDLDDATGRFAPLGFRFKPGRLHADSLLNRHIKFRDGTELEFMTLAGAPTSRMAREYRDLLDAGEGGAYAALWTTDMERVRKAAARLGPPRLTQLGAWQFLSLPSAPEAHAVFFGAGGLPPNDPDSVLAHGNSAVRLAAAWVEGGPALEQLLASLGSHACDSYRLPDGRLGVRWALTGGSLVVIRGRSRRLVGVEVERAEPGPPALNQPLHGFWVLLR